MARVEVLNGAGSPVAGVGLTAATVNGIALSVVSDVPVSRAGSNTVYTLLARNETTVTTEETTVNAPLPAGHRFVAADDPRFEGDTGQWLIGPLRPGAECVVRVTVLVLPTGSRMFRAQVVRRSRRSHPPVEYFAPMVCSPEDDPVVRIEGALFRARTDLPHY